MIFQGRLGLIEMPLVKGHFVVQLYTKVKTLF